MVSRKQPLCARQNAFCHPERKTSPDTEKATPGFQQLIYSSGLYSEPSLIALTHGNIIFRKSITASLRTRGVITYTRCHYVQCCHNAFRYPMRKPFMHGFRKLGSVSRLSVHVPLYPPCIHPPCIHRPCIHRPSCSAVRPGVSVSMQCGMTYVHILDSEQCYMATR